MNCNAFSCNLILYTYDNQDNHYLISSTTQNDLHKIKLLDNIFKMYNHVIIEYILRNLKVKICLQFL